MATVLFIAGIENLTLQTAPGRGEMVANVFGVSTDAAFVRRLIPAEAHDAIGGIEMASLMSGRPVAHSKVLDHSFESEAEAQKDLTNWLTLITVFLQLIWFAKDNAAGLEFGYVIWTSSGRVMTTRNFLSMVARDVTMSATSQHLTAEEFRATRDLFQKEVADPAFVRSNPMRASRLDRAIYFVQAARLASHLPVKIANYCTALEALLSSDAAELTHKLSERAGWLLGRDVTERIDIVQRIKKAYSIRSKVVHGVADWGRDLSAAGDTAAFLDKTLRQLFALIRRSPDLYALFMQDNPAVKEKYDQLFLGLVLGEKLEF